MNALDHTHSNWYKFIQETVEEKGLSLVTIGFTPKKGIYWEIPNAIDFMLVDKNEAPEFFAKDLTTLKSEKVVIVDLLSRMILGTNLEFLELVGEYLSTDAKIVWIEGYDKVVAHSLEILKQHLCTTRHH